MFLVLNMLLGLGYFLGDVLVEEAQSRHLLREEKVARSALVATLTGAPTNPAHPSDNR